MKNNLQNNAVNLKSLLFNNNNEENGVKCADLDKLLIFDTLKDFEMSIKKLSKTAQTLGSFAVCGSYRKTVKLHSKKKFLYLTAKPKMKELQIDSKSFKINSDY